jgi:hypothetical protein
VAQPRLVVQQTLQSINQNCPSHKFLFLFLKINYLLNTTPTSMGSAPVTLLFIAFFHIKKVPYGTGTYSFSSMAGKMKINAHEKICCTSQPKAMNKAASLYFCWL